nr:uncharacterized mitochondrial protein AtMg00810-like [Tanacetum cinerariifolium]
MIDKLDRDEGAVFISQKEEKIVEKVRDNTGDAQVEGREADIYKIDMDHAAKVLISAAVVAPTVTAVSAATVAPTVTAAPVKTPTKTKSKDKGKGIMVEEPKPMKKKQQVKSDEAYARKLHEELNQDIDWEVAIDHVKEKAKKDPFIQRYQAKFNANMEFLLKSKEQIEEEVNRAIESVNETPAQKAAKRRRRNKEVKNFDREDLELLWILVKERFSTSKPNNFFDDYLLTTLRAMFGRPDGQDIIWKSQRSVHGQARVKSWKLLESCGVHIITFTTTKMILLVERRYPLSRYNRKWLNDRQIIDQTLFIKKQKGDILLMQIYVDDIIFGATNKDLCKSFKKLMKDKFQMSSIGELTFFLGLQVKQKEDGIFINQDKYVAEILKKFGLTKGKSASTPIDTKKPLLKDPDGEDVDVHIYRSMIRSLMYLTSSRPDIMFVVCACARFQVTQKVSHLHAVKKISRYLKGKPNLGLWYLKDSPFDLVAYSDSDYAGASLDRKSTTGGCQFL